MTNYLIKICGVRDPEMATQTAMAGANLIGIIFHPLSPRYVSLKKAALISRAVRTSGALPVAVFVEHTFSEMCCICESTHIQIVQLHGTTARAQHHLLPVEYQRIYVQTVSTQGELQTDAGLHYLDPARDLILIDHVNPGQGNKIHASFHYNLPFRWLLAGGLTASNVVMAINTLQPDGVDVSSGVEREKSNKDISLIQQFIRSVRSNKHDGT
jgi:phosphoribosylanthranilate isomerase